jgi:hypothetical protein
MMVRKLTMTICPPLVPLGQKAAGKEPTNQQAFSQQSKDIPKPNGISQDKLTIKKQTTG